MKERTRRLRGHQARDLTDWCLATIAAGLTVLAVCFAIIQVTGVAT